MTFTRKTTEVDLGTTSIENIFINDFMPGAPGTYVKVYLMGYKYACDRDLGLKFSNKMLSRHLGVTVDDVLGAWNFWEGKGIIRKIPQQKRDATDFSVEFLSLRQLYIDNNFNPNAEPGKRPLSEPSSDEPKQPSFDSETSEMFEAIEDIIGRPVSVSEAIEISEYMEAYSMNPSMVKEAYATASEKRGIHTAKYVGGILKNWFDKGVFSIKDLESRRNEESLLQFKYKRIFDALGFSGRNPSKAEKKAMDQWLSEWEFPIDMVLKACENTVYASKPSIQYIHSILTAWQKDGIKTPEDLVKSGSKRKPKRQAAAPSKANKFHNFKQAPPDYSEDELKKILKEINNLK